MKSLRASAEIALTCSSAVGDFATLSGSLAPVRSSPARSVGSNRAIRVRSSPLRLGASWSAFGVVSWDSSFMLDADRLGLAARMRCAAKL